MTVRRMLILSNSPVAPYLVIILPAASILLGWLGSSITGVVPIVPVLASLASAVCYFVAERFYRAFCPEEIRALALSSDYNALKKKKLDELEENSKRQTSNIFLSERVMKARLDILVQKELPCLSDGIRDDIKKNLDAKAKAAARLEIQQSIKNEYERLSEDAILVENPMARECPIFCV
ncbi:hypothetical protein [Pukyongiella litopenaei]|uniref:Uncharacterized protein n=1 Tax=Pukyongiella litopenaei TaxID=2605946 RepID=A0A5C2H5S0_9RHOB|nr:hypothetical protein [Pukyongiella litopenaei]QEP30312.1 hypothetical protein C6Y53_18960 [Pukyongiella litopenaei]